MKKLVLAIIAADLLLFGAIAGGFFVKRHLAPHTISDTELDTIEIKAYSLGVLDNVYALGPSRSGVPLEELCTLKDRVDAVQPKRFVVMTDISDFHDKYYDEITHICKEYNEIKPDSKSAVNPNSFALRPGSN